MLAHEPDRRSPADYERQTTHQAITHRTHTSAVASIRIELALLSKGFRLAVRAKKLRSKPYIPKPKGDPSRVRQGFFSREDVDALCAHLDADLADIVRFLFFSAWRVGEVRTL
jgi:integrase